jgi:hypothetical protein
VNGHPDFLAGRGISQQQLGPDHLQVLNLPLGFFNVTSAGLKN